MESNVRKVAQEVKKEKVTPTVSATLSDGTLVEMVYRPDEAQTAFVLWQHEEWKYEAGISLGPRQRIVPYSPGNNLIKHEVVLFPSGPEEYGSEEHLLKEIQTFIHQYVDVSPLFEKIATYYVLFSWVYDGGFNELPYLRLRGDPGSGKTRFLLIVGSLCYKPMFASGASTVSPLFRIIDIFRGTLIIDEGDFRLSTEHSEVIKILNNGNARGFPVLRTETTPKREFDPRAFAVFGPKLVATRGFFQDRALESRCLTEEMGQHRLRNDVPINLPSTYKEEALHIRNKLLLFRFRNLHKREATESLVDRSIEPRLNQIFVPLLSIIDDAQARDDLRELARQYNHDLLAERGMDMEAQILEIIRDLFASGEVKPSIKDITSWFTDKYAADYERKVTAKWIGGIIRKRLNLKPQKSNGVFVIPLSEKSKLERLYEKYGISSKDPSGPTPENGIPEPS
jgi:hypothetical protein